MTIFKDRREAGRQLTSKLAHLLKQDGIVFGLARGGIITAQPIAEFFGWPLRPLIVRKIGHPLAPEYAIGALTAAGDSILNEAEAASIDGVLLEELIQREKNEARRREILYAKDLPAISPKRKTAVIVDDGVATGLTLKLAIKFLRKEKPNKIVVACPVAPTETAKEISSLADEAIFLKADEDFLGAVGAYYLSFPQVSDEEVTEALRN